MIEFLLFVDIYILSTIWNVLNTPFFGAFFGAFFAFVFGIMAYHYTKRREKWKIHHNAIVRAERLVNRHLNQISGNKHLLKGALETYKKGNLQSGEATRGELLKRLELKEFVKLYF